MRGDKILRGDKVRFEPIPTDLTFEKKLSLKAKGLYVFLRSKPDNWDFSAERIARDNVDGRESVMSGLRELVASGYVTRRRNGDGSMEYVTWSKPQSGNPTEGTAEPQSAKPTEDPPPSVGKPHSGKSPQWEKPTDNTTQTIVDNTDERRQHSCDLPVAGEGEPELVAPPVPVTRPDADIVAVLHAFQTTGLSPHIRYGFPKNRSAAAELVAAYGLERTVKLVEFAASVAGKEFAPTITTPGELLEKYAKLKAYGERMKHSHGAIQSL